MYHGRTSALLAEQLSSSGDLRGAILAYEALVHAEPENAEAWLRLGSLQQLNEMDVQAIPALREALRFGATTALLALAASLVNESCIPEALETLRTWLQSTTGSSIEFVEGPTRLASLIRAISVEAGGSIDGNVALSILFSITGNHSQASECLEKTLQSEPNRLDLLNRMGAVLANNQRYAEALQLYDRSLAIDPNCPRVHYNRGVSLMCTKYHNEASKAFVQALRNQLPVDVVEGVDLELVDRYTAVWDTLRSNCEAAGYTEDSPMMRAIAARDLHNLESLV
jgi:tetratricopeptide (TPR) repeat protein